MMKKALSLLTALLILFACIFAGAAAAENETVAVSNFTLTIESGAEYEIDSDDPSYYYVTLHPYCGQGDMLSSYTFIGQDLSYLAALKPADLNAFTASDTERRIKGYENDGITVNRYEVSDYQETSLCGITVWTQDTDTDIVNQGRNTVTFQRSYMFPEKNCYVIFTTISSEKRDNADTILETILHWN